MNDAVVDSQGRIIKEGLPGELRRWFNSNEWALMFDVRVGRTGETKPATVYMGRREK